MQFRGKLGAGGLILVLLIAVSAWVWTQGRDLVRDMTSASSNDSASTPENPESTKLGIADRHTAAPLPPLEMPVADMFDDLKKRADRGDALASCRLAVELINCNQLDSLAQAGYVENSKSAEADLAQSGLLVEANSVANQQIRQLESMKRCEGTSAEQRGLAGTYLLQAANAGIPEAMIRYAEGQSVTTGSSMYGLLHDKGFNRWHRDAARFLEKALEHGEPAAVFGLYVATSDDNSLLGGLIADDPAKAYRYRLLMSRLRGKDDAPVGKLSPEQLMKARQDVSRMHAEYFNNRILSEPDAFSSLLTPAWARPAGLAPRRPCE